MSLNRLESRPDSRSSTGSGASGSTISVGRGPNPPVQTRGQVVQDFVRADQQLQDDLARHAAADDRTNPAGWCAPSARSSSGYGSAPPSGYSSRPPSAASFAPYGSSAYEQTAYPPYAPSAGSRASTEFYGVGTPPRATTSRASSAGLYPSYPPSSSGPPPTRFQPSSSAEARPLPTRTGDPSVSLPFAAPPAVQGSVVSGTLQQGQYNGLGPQQAGRFQVRSEGHTTIRAPPARRPTYVAARPVASPRSARRDSTDK